MSSKDDLPVYRMTDRHVPIAYIAGPYSAPFPWKLRNIWMARRYAKKYWKLGYAVICPHSNSALFDGVVSHDAFIDGDRAIVSVSSVVILIDNWDKSKGAVDELWEAVVDGKHIIFEHRESWGKALIQRMLKLAWGSSRDFHSCLVLKPGTEADDLDIVVKGGVLYSICDGVLQQTPVFDKCGGEEDTDKEE